MPSDISPSRLGAPAATIEPTRARAPLPPEPSVAEAASAAPDSGKSLPNPTLRLDPGLALVVIEFRDDSGQVRDTIPTQAQLDAYRSWDRIQSGDPPPGMPSAAARADASTPRPPTPVPGVIPTVGPPSEAGGAPAPVVSAPAPPPPAAMPAPANAPPVAAPPVGQFKVPSTGTA